MVLGGLGKAECGLSAPVAPAGPGGGSGGAQALGTRFPVETMTEGPGGSSVAGLGSAWAQWRCFHRVPCLRFHFPFLCV